MPAPRLSLAAQLWVVVTTAAVLCGGLITLNMQVDQQRDRDRATAELKKRAQVTGATLTPELQAGNETEATLANVAAQASVTALGSSCVAALDGLQQAIDVGYLEVVDASGRVLCTSQAKHRTGTPWAATSALLEAVALRRTLTDGPITDPWSQATSIFTVVPLKTRTAASLLYVSPSQESMLPDDPDASVETLLVDTRTMTVLMRYPSPGNVVGERLRGEALRHSVLSDELTSSTGIDGVDRLYTSLQLGRSHFRLLTGVSEADAFAVATQTLHRNLAMGGMLVVLLAGLGLLLHRQIARPTLRLRAAIEHAADDPDVLAPVGGPTELAALGQAFNEMLAARRGFEDTLAHQAMHDPLTGLPNRRHVTEQLDALIAEGGRCAAVFLDLDRFKLVNDSHGHAVGDALLVVLGERLQAAVRPQDVIGRFGGDEFVVAVADLDDEAAAVELAERIRRVLVEPVRIDGRELFISGSVGLAVHAEGEDAQTVLRHADTAMYRAKARGRNRAELFDAAMREAAVAQLRTQSDLHRALEREQLHVLYQPVVDLADGRVLGAEALVRWQHPDRGLVSPADFIPVAEETGLVVPIGGWVLREACTWAVRAAEREDRPVRVAVNVSSRQLAQTDFPDVVADALTTTGLSPQLLCLEVTESMLVEDSDLARRHLEGLRLKGVRVALDDFGTGWSSLTSLQQLPVDEIKLDRSFVSQVTEDDTAAAIVGSLIDMAEAMGLHVTAEGIETAEQLAFLQAKGNVQGQGYLFARPLSADDIGPFLASGAVLPSWQGRMDG